MVLPSLPSANYKFLGVDANRNARRRPESGVPQRGNVESALGCSVHHLATPPGLARARLSRSALARWRRCADQYQGRGQCIQRAKVCKSNAYSAIGSGKPNSVPIK